MNETLEYLLNCAEYGTPVLHQSIFEEREDVDFAYLRRSGFLVENGNLGGSIMVCGEPVPVRFDSVSEKYFYWDENEYVTVAPELLTEYDVSYEPLAKLLGRAYCDDEDADCIVPNGLWNIGVPIGGNASVYLARNVGSDPKVRDELAELPSEDTVLWFGKRPPRGITPATLVQLSKFLLWGADGIAHKDEWPATLGTNGERRYKNAIILRGDFWEIWFNGGKSVHLESTLNGMRYIIRMIEAGENGLNAKQVAPPDVLPDEVPVDRDELAYGFGDADLDLPEYSDEELRQLRRSYAETKAKLTRAKNTGDTTEVTRLQGIVDEYDKHMKHCTRPGGKSVMATSQMKNLTRRIASAVTIVCKRLADKNHKRQDIANHFKTCIEARQTCRYTDTSRHWHIKD